MLDASMRPVTSDSDYAAVKRAIEFFSACAREKPSIAAIAAHLGLEPAQLRRLIQRWAGLDPEAFFQAISIGRARELLRDSAGALDAERPGRGALFVAHEAMTPGPAEGLELGYGFHASPFGEALLITAPQGLAGLGFVDEGNRAFALADMSRRWSKARFLEDAEGTALAAARAFNPALWRAERPLKLLLIGTGFETRAWEMLLSIPMGRMTTYSDIARKLNRPKAARAVGAAVGKNPISFVVPCHRVLGRSGALTGYHWGLLRKQAMIGWEAGRIGGT